MASLVGEEEEYDGQMQVSLSLCFKEKLWKVIFKSIKNLFKYSLQIYFII